MVGPTGKLIHQLMFENIYIYILIKMPNCSDDIFTHSFKQTYVIVMDLVYVATGVKSFATIHARIEDSLNQMDQIVQCQLT